MLKYHRLTVVKLLSLIIYRHISDFPGLCFASTRCATIEPGNSWELTPFCGRSTCVKSEDKPPRLLELVEDCGPLPLANPKCKLDEGRLPLMRKIVYNHIISYFHNLVMTLIVSPSKLFCTLQPLEISVSTRLNL